MNAILPNPTPDPLPRLATPGERLGWIFNDRNSHRQPFGETPPQPERVAPELVEQRDQAVRLRGRRMAVAIGAGLGVAVLIGCCGAGAARLGDGPSDGTVTVLLGFLAVIAALGGIGGAVYAAWLPGRAQRRLSEAQELARTEYARDHAAWDSRRQWHDQQQQHAVDAMAEWGAAGPSPGTRRVDIIGGTSYGWEAVLTVYGGSLLATRGAMTLVDFTGEALSDELIRLALTTGRSVAELRLPAELERFDLIAGLGPDELVDVLVEAMHGDDRDGTRAERSQDAMLLQEICRVLAPDLTVARILAALRVLSGRSEQPTLSSPELERLFGLPPEDARRLRRIEAFLHPFEAMGSAPAEVTATDLTCLVADGGGGSAQNELLKDLMVEWLARQVRKASPAVGSLVLLGADEIHHRAIERLSGLCERRGVRLVLFFAHLRAESLRTIGGGEVALMRLGNHQEATQAAEFVGRGHKFVVSRITRTLGGEDTHTMADTYGEAETRGGYAETIRGRGVFSRRRGTQWSKTRNWSQTESVAKGTNWSDAESAERVHEYTVEPRTLQDLPEYAMVLVKGEGAGAVVQAVEVDPAIVTLPRVSMEPLALPAARTPVTWDPTPARHERA